MLIYISGIKGGVGKSFISYLTIHYFMSNKEIPLVIETDTSASDVYYTYKDTLKENLITANPETPEGWVLILNTAKSNKDRPIIVNAPAKEDLSLQVHGNVLNKLAKFGIDVITLFVISDNGNAVKQLAFYLKQIKQKICVVKNANRKNMAENDFFVFNESEFVKNGLKSVFIKNELSGYVSKYTSEVQDSEKKPLEYLYNPETGDFGFILLSEDWLYDSMEKIKKALEVAEIYHG